MAYCSGDAINSCRQAHEFGLMNSILAAGVSYMTDNTVKAMGDIAKGAWVLIAYSATLDTPNSKAFVSAWSEYYPGTTPTNFEGQQYAGMQVLFQGSPWRAASRRPILRGRWPA